MQKFYCIAKDKYREDSWHFVTFEAESKKEFLHQVRSNGYAVRHNKAYTEEEFKNI